MGDGLYRVVTPHFVAAFIVKDNVVVACAPILRKLLRERREYVMSQAERIGP